MMTEHEVTSEDRRILGEVIAGARRTHFPWVQIDVAMAARFLSLAALAHARAGAAERGAREVTDEMVEAAAQTLWGNDLIPDNPWRARYPVPMQHGLLAVARQSLVSALAVAPNAPSPEMVERAAGELANANGWHWENAACPRDQFTALARRALTAALCPPSVDHPREAEGC
jgi:hypothetical protein